MRSLLVLAFLLYNFVAYALRNNVYDYDDPEGMKRHSIVDERRNWRKKALLKPFEQEYKEWNNRRYEHDIPGYLEDLNNKHFVEGDRRDTDPSESLYGGQRHYDDGDNRKLTPKLLSAEIGHSTHFLDKDNEKSIPFTMTCGRIHERYEPCFAGCAAVTCDNPRERLRPCYPFCEPGCVCVQPYIRDDRTHKCVLPEDCTKGLKGIPDLGVDT